MLSSDVGNSRGILSFTSWESYREFCIRKGLPFKVLSRSGRLQFR